MLRDIQSFEVLVCNRALITLIAVSQLSQLPLKLKLYVILWTSCRCAERLVVGTVRFIWSRRMAQITNFDRETFLIHTLELSSLKFV